MSGSACHMPHPSAAYAAATNTHLIIGQSVSHSKNQAKQSQSKFPITAQVAVAFEDIYHGYHGLMVKMPFRGNIQIKVQPSFNIDSWYRPLIVHDDKVSYSPLTLCAGRERGYIFLVG